MSGQTDTDNCKQNLPIHSNDSSKTQLLAVIADQAIQICDMQSTIAKRDKTIHHLQDENGDMRLTIDGQRHMLDHFNKVLQKTLEGVDY